MSVPPESIWKVAASSGYPQLAIDDSYASAWRSGPSKKAWLRLDLGAVVMLGGLEVYWGKQAPTTYGFEASVDGKGWTHLCETRRGEGGQDVFAFPPVAARFVRWACETRSPERGWEVVEINLYGPTEAASVVEPGRVSVLGHAPIKLPPGESVTVDFGRVRSPLGAFIEWGEDYGTIFSVHLSDDGTTFREVGRIETGDGDSDSF
jgi:F5/8 type C domain